MRQPYIRQMQEAFLAMLQRQAEIDANTTTPLPVETIADGYKIIELPENRVVDMGDEGLVGVIEVEIPRYDKTDPATSLFTWPDSDGEKDW